MLVFIVFNSGLFYKIIKISKSFIRLLFSSLYLLVHLHKLLCHIHPRLLLKLINSLLNGLKLSTHIRTQFLMIELNIGQELINSIIFLRQRMHRINYLPCDYFFNPLIAQ